MEGDESQERSRIYGCPGCGRSTYHYVNSQGLETTSVVCLSCGTSHAVDREEFESYECRYLGDDPY